MSQPVRDYAVFRTAARRRPPRAALILGSGLSGLGDVLEDAVELPFACVPGLDASSVPGHRGVLMLGTWANVPVLAFAGRLHFYEGHAWDRVVRPVHVAHELGASILIATNAAGGIRADLSPGDLMALHGHLDCTQPGWWRATLASNAPSPPTPLPRWGEGINAAPYSTRLLTILQQLGLPTGVYAQLTGPCYETPAEIRAIRICGADAVGMSTGREIATGFELGMECAAISCITNKAAGLGSGSINHEEVLETGRRVRDRLIGVLTAMLARV
jgi:purine-nucleoside phosphorylase